MSVDGIEVRWVSGGSLEVLRSSSPSLACKLSGRPGQGLAEETPGDFECLLLREWHAPDAIPILIKE